LCRFIVKITDKDVAAQDVTQETEEETPYVDDRALEVSALNSNKFRPRDFASCEVEPPDDLMMSMSYQTRTRQRSRSCETYG